MTVVGIVKTNSGVDYHRVYLPLRFLPVDQTDMCIILNEKSEKADEFFERADILYLNRHFMPYSIPQLEEIIIKFNLKLVVDLDDYWKLYKHHIIYDAWQKGEMEYRIQSTLQLADLVIVTHEKLANECRPINGNVEILPNSLPLGHDQFIYSPTDHDRFKILYAGGNSHLADIRSVDSLFRKLGSNGTYKQKGSFILGGYHNPNNDPHNVWHSMETIVKRSGSFERYGAQPVGEYMKMYDGADMTVAPLENNTFNSYKSNLKTIESGCKHLPIVASNMHPYNLDADVQGVTLCDSIAEWFKAIIYYISNPSKAKEDGEALFEYVNRNYNLLNVNKKRYEILKSL